MMTKKYGILCTYSQEAKVKYDIGHDEILVECDGNGMLDLDRTRLQAKRFLSADWVASASMVELVHVEGVAND